MRAKEFIIEIRQGLMRHVKQTFPNMPDYVAQDLIYKNSKNSPENVTKIWVSYYGNMKWKFVSDFRVAEDVWSEETLSSLEFNKRSSSSDEAREHFPTHAARYNRQRDAIASKGISKEPIIVEVDGSKFNLLEGWHRTTEALKAFPEGYTCPAYIGYKTHQSEQVKKQITPTLWQKFRGVFK